MTDNTQKDDDIKHELKILQSGSWKLTVTEEDGKIEEDYGARRPEMTVEVECSCGAEFSGYNEEAIEHIKHPEETRCTIHGTTFGKDEDCEYCEEEGISDEERKKALNEVYNK